ncbi:MAG: NAD(P)/FAD-dependent oxidoreductase, partial [Clostridiales bacterium]|nr:NAD(P)/FAD-dependent oxidoreductase [Clostridiales bacterium]
MKKYDLVVVGSGAGFIVLDATLDSGLKCALIEKDQIGGTCLSRGCIPSRMLVYPADLIREAERAPKLGVTLGKPKVDWQLLGERMFEKIGANKEIRQAYMNTPNLDVYEGTASFVDAHAMHVTLKDGTVTEPFTAERFLLAGGARSGHPDVEGLDAIDPLTYEQFFGARFPKKPWKSLTIIGGGIIATEFAHIFAAMGTKVTIVGRAPQLLRGEEPEVSAFLADQYRAFGIRLLLGHTAIKASRVGGKKRVTARCVETGKLTGVDSEEVLVASGVVPNSDL